MIINQRRKQRLKVSLLLCVAVITGFCIMLHHSRMYPFGPDSIMRIDLDTQYADFVQFFVRSSLWEKLYSFQKGFGGPTLGFISYYAISPFNLIALLFRPENLETAIFVILMVKFVFMAQSMYVYLCSHYENLYANAAWGMAYAFFPVFARWYYHIIWLDCFALLPLLILATERVMHTGKKGLFIALYFYSLISNYYISVMSGMFILLYFVYYAMAVMEVDLKTMVKKTIDMAYSTLTAVMLASPVLIPSFIQLTEGKLTDGTITTATSGRMFEPVYFISSFFEGMYIYNVPQIAGCVCSIFLIMNFFSGRKTSLKHRLAAAVFLAFMIYSLYDGILHYVWHGFSNPIAFYYRHNYLVAFLVLALSRRGLEQLNTDAILRSVPASLAVYMLCFVAVKKDYRLPADRTALILTLVSVIICTAVICFAVIKPTVAKYCLCAVMAVTAVINRAAYSATDKMVYDSVYPTDTAGNYKENYIRVQTALEKTDTGFYRIADIDARDYNQPMGNHYYGTNHYSSTFDRNQKEMFVHFGYGDTFYSTIYSHSNPLTDSLFGVKYLLSDSTQLPAQYTLVSQSENGSRSLYTNSYRLPVAFTGVTNNVEYIDYWPQHVADMLYRLTGHYVLNNDYSTDFIALKKASEAINSDAAEVLYENGSIMKIKAEGQYLLTTIMYDENWHIWVNGEKAEAERFMEYFLSVPIDGPAEITMIYTPQGFMGGIALAVIAMVLLAANIYTKKKRNRYEQSET
ncbi:MAG: YfhO family protein [Oscillospiraceae bacterium]|nr:YfhO family protein [Oscillospiraceae bacterium]